MSRSGLARFNAGGSLDTSFGSPGFGGVIGVQTDGKIIIGGGLTNGAVSRLNQDGSVDSSFVASADFGALLCLAVQADGKILLELRKLGETNK